MGGVSWAKGNTRGECLWFYFGFKQCFTHLELSKDKVSRNSCEHKKPNEMETQYKNKYKCADVSTDQNLVVS